MSDKLIIRIDASAIKESACMLRFYRTVIEGYRGTAPTNDMVFGTAFHEFIAEMKRTRGNYALATQAAKKAWDVEMFVKPTKKYLTDNYLIRQAMAYWDDYLMKDDFVTLEKDGEPLVELKFAFPFYVDDDFEVLLCGTIDDICKHKRGTYALRDYKTTSVTDSQGYMLGYWLSPQLMFYRLILRYYAEKYPNSIFSEINKLTVGCFIDGIFLHGATKDPDYIRSDVMMFPEQQMKDFEHLLHAKIMHLLNFLRMQTVPMREGMINGACETKYGSCAFAVACRQPDDIAMGHVLRRNFIQRPYDPLNFSV